MDYIVIIGIVVLVICLLYILVTYNKFVKLINNVKESFATMDVYLKKRWDLIPNIVEVVKGYAHHEKDTLKEIVALRNQSYDNFSTDEKLKTNGEINKNITKLMALVESYPDLKANESFLSLNKELTSIEDEIAQSRKYYNAVVRDFNNMVEMIPSNIVAKVLGYKVKNMFEANDYEKENVRVKL